MHFALSYSAAARRFFTRLGAGPARAGVEVEERRVRVRMGFWFRADLDREAIVAARRDTAPVRAWGVHGWRGTWLVNGSSQGVVRIDLQPPQPARTLVVPLRLRTLRVAVDDPDGLVAALRR